MKNPENRGSQLRAESHSRLSAQLSDTDLHLYLARALPRRQTWYLRLALFLSPDLRQRLAALQAEIQVYREERQPRLAEKMFGPWHSLPRAAEAAPSPQDALGIWRRRGPLLAMASVLVVALGIWPIYLTERMAEQITTQGGQGADADVPLYTAKGAPAEMQLFVKGDTLSRVTGLDVSLTPGDTLQLVPPGGSQPYVAIYGYEYQNGIAGPMVRIFPKSGLAASQVSAAKPPPGLTVSGSAENRLICIASDRGFDLALAESTLSNPSAKAGSSSWPKNWPKGWRVQAYSIKARP